jgi:hypothetical protein
LVPNQTIDEREVNIEPKRLTWKGPFSKKTKDHSNAPSRMTPQT